MDSDGPFDRRLRRLRRDRAANAGGAADYLGRLIADELFERLTLVSVSFADALDLSCGDGEISRRLADRGLSVVSADAGNAFATRNCGVQCDEDRLPFADASFDLVMCAGGLDTVNDLPGALALIRRALRPNGLFLAAFAGAGSLPRLRSAMLAGDLAGGGGAAPRIHPQIDVRAAGDLLLRAGFKLPVVDGHRLSIRFPGMAALVADLRALGATNILLSRSPPVNRAGLAAAIADFAANADADGKTVELLEIVHLTAWAS
jgi:SAM-dependent methyltransferase